MNQMPTAQRIREALDSVLEDSVYISAKRDAAGSIHFAAVKTDHEAGSSSADFAEKVFLDDLFSIALRQYRRTEDVSSETFASSLRQLSYALAWDLDKAQEQIYSEEYNLKNRQFGRYLLSWFGFGAQFSEEIDIAIKRTILQRELEIFKLKTQNTVVVKAIARYSNGDFDE